MGNGKAVAAAGGYEVRYDAQRFRIFDAAGKERAWAFTNGTFGKPLGGAINADSIPAAVKALVTQAMQTVNAQFAAARNEMFPNFATLESSDKRLAQIDIMERLGYMDSHTAADKRTAEKVIEARAQVMDSRERTEAERERFDNE